MDEFNFANTSRNETTIQNITNFPECDVVQSEHLQSSYFQGTMYIMYSVVFAISIFGNGIVCYIVISSPRMRTVTNYFIMNLAVGDILITILCIPFTAVSYLLQYWPFNSFLCPVVNYSQAVSVFVSAYTLVAISVDRYIAIMWPLRPRLAKKSSAFIISSVWSVALVTVLPIAITSNIFQPDDKWYEDCDLYICKEEWSFVGMEYRQMYTKALFVLQYVIPLSVLLFTYTSIAIMIWCHRIPGEAENFRDQRIARSKRKMIKMMMIVVIVYTICWLPINLFWIIVENYEINKTFLTYLWFASHWFAMSHTCYNPIIYCYMNTRFRTGFLQAMGSVPCFRRCCPSLFIHRPSSTTSFPLTSVGGTDSTILHRNNTCTTYISMRRKNGSRLSHNYQTPLQLASTTRTVANYHQAARSVRSNVLENEI